MDVSTAIVDVGSHTIKAGLGSATTPEFIPSIAGVHKYRALFPTRTPGSAVVAESSLFVGRDVVSRRGLLKLSYPVRHGTVTDWPAMVALLRQSQRRSIHSLSYTSGTLLTSSSAAHTAGIYSASAAASTSPPAAVSALSTTTTNMARPSVYALIESPFTSRVQRRRLIELILERGGMKSIPTTNDSYSLPAENDEAERGSRQAFAEAADRDDYGGNEVTHLFCGVAPLLALYSTGQTTGVCIDVGEGVVSTAAAVNGFALTRVMQRVSGGGATGGGVTAYLQTLLPQAGGTLNTIHDIDNYSHRTCCIDTNNTDDGTGLLPRGAEYGSAPSTSLHAPSPYISSSHKNGSNRISSRRECDVTALAQEQSDMMSLLCAGGHAATELVREIKESCGRVATRATGTAAGCHGPSYREEPSTASALFSSSSPSHLSQPQQRHRLPDGSEIVIGSEATEASEVLFEPSRIGSDSPGVADLVMQTVRLSEMELRPQLLSHVLVCGGSTLLAGFGLRMLNELLARTPRENRVRVVAPAERGYAAWLGAAFLSQLSTFATDMVVTRAEYEEHGESIIHARMFK